MTKLPSSATAAQSWLAIGLALIAGYVDGYGLLTFSVFVSFMSGNTTQASTMSGAGNFTAALPSAVAIVSFVIGTLAGAWVCYSGMRLWRSILFGAIAFLLALIIGTTELGWLNSHVGIATLSLAMGLMNTTLSRVGAEAVNVTFVTGTLNKLGQHLAQALRRLPLTDAQGPQDTHLRRASLMACLWTSFALGAVLSGAVNSYFGVWTLLAPLLALLVLALLRAAERVL